MALNRETNKIEPVTEVDDALLAEKMARLQLQDDAFHPGIVRADGSPVPKTWALFKVGELVVLKDNTFKVAHFNESCVVLEPADLSIAKEGK